MPEEGIYRADTDELITDHIRDLQEDYQAEKVRNRLLDGSWHVQTIGEPAPVLIVSIGADYQARRQLNNYEARSERIKIKHNGDTWTGIMKDEIQWSEQGWRYYNGEFTLLVDAEEG